MLSFSSAVRIFLAVEPLDMCKYFDGLYAVAANELKENPQQGSMFVFSNVCGTSPTPLSWPNSKR